MPAIHANYVVKPNLFLGKTGNQELVSCLLLCCSRQCHRVTYY